MSTVFIPQMSRNFEQHDVRDTLEKASAFGRVVVLVERSDDVRRPDATIAKFMELMKDFSDDDYLLPMGSQHFMLWAGIIAAGKVKERLQTLQWDIQARDYRVSTLNLNQIRIGANHEEKSYTFATRRGEVEISKRRSR